MLKGELVQRENQALLARVPLLATSSEHEMSLLVDHTEVVTFQANAEIFRQAQHGLEMYIVVAGSAISRHGDKEVEMTAGQFFGEQALLHDTPRASTVAAGGAGVRCLRLR
jgi:CRP-like cAMP-binding protein